MKKTILNTLVIAIAVTFTAMITWAVNDSMWVDGVFGFEFEHIFGIFLDGNLGRNTLIATLLIIVPVSSMIVWLINREKK